MAQLEVIVEADGGSRGNPGPAGYGAVVFDADHARVLAERREYIGVATNNVAEYRGLIAGLEAAAELGARVVSVRMDSKLVVEQMSGNWKVKHAAMIPLADRARRLVAGFDRVTFTWIPRAENSYADRLANEVMDDATLVGEVRTALDAGHLPAAASADRNVPSGGETAEPNSPRAEPNSPRAGSNPPGAGSNPPSAGSNPPSAGTNPPGAGTNPSDAVSSTPIAGSNTQGAERTTAPAQSTAPGWTGATGRPTRFLLLRHGQTELSVQRRYSGRGNPPLTELGREQRRGSRRCLPPRAMSPLWLPPRWVALVRPPRPRLPRWVSPCMLSTVSSRPTSAIGKV